jgi:hypothetical protein
LRPAKKAANSAKRQAILDKRATLIRATQNKIKSDWKTRGIAARKQERERKKVIEALQMAK